MDTDLPLTTGPAAARAHRHGVELLVAGEPVPAAAAFRHAVAEDPCFALAHAALAVALADAAVEEHDDTIEALARARSCSRRVSRYERHHVEIVVLALRGRSARASDLGREHLSEFPDDLVVRRVLDRWCGEAG